MSGETSIKKGSEGSVYVEIVDYSPDFVAAPQVVDFSAARLTNPDARGLATSMRAVIFEKMTVTLESGGAFTVVPAGSQPQLIQPGGRIKWTISPSPNAKAERHKLTVKVRLPDNSTVIPDDQLEFSVQILDEDRGVVERVTSAVSTLQGMVIGITTLITGAVGVVTLVRKLRAPKVPPPSNPGPPPPSTTGPF